MIVKRMFFVCENCKIKHAFSSEKKKVSEASLAIQKKKNIFLITKQLSFSTTKTIYINSVCQWSTLTL